jgi:hypothetical protein
MNDSDTISEAYRAQQQELHKDPTYGTASISFAPLIQTLLELPGVNSVADYGAGKCHLQRALHQLGKTDFEYRPYDPAFPEYGPPRAADLVCCIDVLEHIEEPYLDNVLNDLKRMVGQLGFFSIHSGPARKLLPDGRNAHLIQQPSSWWLPRLCAYFEIDQLQGAPGGFWVLVAPRSGA